MLDVQSKPFTSLDLGASARKNLNSASGFQKEFEQKNNIPDEKVKWDRKLNSSEKNDFKARPNQDLKNKSENKEDSDLDSPKKLRSRMQSNNAMFKFMDSMESELNVTPDRMMAAWAMMKPTELAQSPEETAQQFVDNLNLSGGSQTKAMNLYQNMLSEKQKEDSTSNKSDALLGASFKQSKMNATSEFNATQLVNEQGKPSVRSTLDISQFNLESDPQNPTDLNLSTFNLSNVNNNGKSSSHWDVGSMNVNEDLDGAELNSHLDSQANLKMNPQNAEVEFQADARANLQKNSELTANTNSKSNLAAGSKNDSKVDSNSELTAESKKNSNSDMNSEVNSDENFDAELNSEADVKNGEVNAANGKLQNLNAFQRKQKLNHSIDQMNNRFFMNPLEQKEQALAENQKPANELMSMEDKGLKSQSMNSKMATDTNAKDSLKTTDLSHLAPRKSELKGSASMNAEDSAGFEDSMNEGGDASFQDVVYNKLKSEWGQKVDGNEKSLQSLSQQQPTHMSENDRVQNIQKIMDQARILSQAGGGEVRVKLTPEGLGDVHLRMMVQNGKVDLEFKTPNKEVQKLLESNLNDLKSNLAQHRLSVDKVQVDVGSHDSMSSQDQFAKNMNQQNWNEARDQARQFMGNFRDNNFFQRQNMMEIPGIQGYQTRKGEDLEPIRNESARARNYGEAKGSGLNLVA